MPCAAFLRHGYEAVRTPGTAHKAQSSDALMSRHLCSKKRAAWQGSPSIFIKHGGTMLNPMFGNPGRAPSKVVLEAARFACCGPGFSNAAIGRHVGGMACLAAKPISARKRPILCVVKIADNYA